jgi:hypothetical protein
MAIDNANRLFFLALMGALTVVACRAQDTQSLPGGAPQAAGPDSERTPAAPLAELAPPKAPTVTCANNQLTISAENSTLGGVLAAVHACTGVQVDIPEGAARSRVFEDLGPGPAREVLESLLNGTEFNFVIGSSDADPRSVASILLMPRPVEPASAQDAGNEHVGSAMRRAWLLSRQNRAASLLDENHPASDETVPATEPEDTAPAPDENASAAPAQAPAADPSPAGPEAPASSGNSASPLTPPVSTQPTSTPASDPGQSTEEKITSMQQLFQQRREMNQTQGPTSTQP